MKITFGRIAAIWIHLALGLMIAAEVTFIVLGMVFVMPMCQEIASDGDAVGLDAFVPGATNLLGLLQVARHYAPWWVIVFAIAWGLFEWRVPRENKASLRLAAMVTVTLLLLAVGIMFATVMIIPTAQSARKIAARQPEQLVGPRMTDLDQWVSQLDQALVKRDWPAAHERAHEAMGAAEDLTRIGGAAATLLTLKEQAKVDELRNQLNSMAASLREVWAASRRSGEAERADAAMQKFHDVYREVKRETAGKAK